MQKTENRFEEVADKTDVEVDDEEQKQGRSRKKTPSEYADSETESKKPPKISKSANKIVPEEQEAKAACCAACGIHLHQDDWDEGALEIRPELAKERNLTSRLRFVHLSCWAAHPEDWEEKLVMKEGTELVWNADPGIQEEAPSPSSSTAPPVKAAPVEHRGRKELISNKIPDLSAAASDAVNSTAGRTGLPPRKLVFGMTSQSLHKEDTELDD